MCHIGWVLHHPMIDCLTLPVILSPPSRSCCTQLTTFPLLQVNKWIESELPSRLSLDLPDPQRPPRVSPPILIDHGIQVHLQTRLITASDCISQFTRSQHSSASPNSLNHSLQLNYQTCWNMVSMYLSKLTQSWCGEMDKLDGSKHMINTLPHLSRYPNGIGQKEWLLLKVCNERVRGCYAVLCCDEQHRLHGLMKPRQECKWPRAVKDRVCISYNEMMSIYPMVIQIYTPSCSAHYWNPGISVPTTPHCSVHPRYCRMSVHPLTVYPHKILWRLWWVPDFRATTASWYISKFCLSLSQAASLTTLEYCVQPDWPYIYILQDLENPYHIMM